MRLVAYLRVSTDAQVDGYGLADQEATIRAWARRAGHRLAAVYADEGRSGAEDLTVRTELAAALEAISGGGAAGVVVARLDRLARDLIIQEQLMAEIWRTGGEVWSAAAGEADLRNDPADPSRKMVRRILGVIAEYERDMIVLRLQRGRAIKASRGGYAYGSPRFGWRSVDHELVPDAAEQAAIRRARTLKREGRSLREIAAQLASEGHRPKRGGTAWHPTAVRRLLADAGR